MRTRRALFLAAIISMSPMLALGQSSGGYRQNCQQVIGGQIVCKQVPGSAGAGSRPSTSTVDRRPSTVDRPSTSPARYSLGGQSYVIDQPYTAGLPVTVWKSSKWNEL